MGAIPTPGISLLAVHGLSVTYRTESTQIVALRDVEFSINAGEIVGVLGESGSGKSTLAMALLRCLPMETQVSGGIALHGRELPKETEMRHIRGAKISVVFQDALLPLSPMISVGDQVLEVLRTHTNVAKTAGRTQVLELFSELGFDDPARIYSAYPHQLSGGQCQRISIAQALICRPDLIIADEPTASLDAETALGIVQLIRDIKQKHSVAFLLISHDPAIIRALADRIIVLRQGQIAETGTTHDVLGHPSLPYTKLLIAAEHGDLLDEEEVVRT